MADNEPLIDRAELRSFVARVKRLVWHAVSAVDRADDKYQWDERYKIMEQCDKLMEKLKHIG